MRRRRNPFILGLAIVFLAAAALGVARQKTPTQSSASQAQTSQASAVPGLSKYVGSDTCKTCHADVYTSWEKSPHWKTMLDNKGGPSKQGCEGCHGPGAEHAETADPSKIFTFVSAPAKVVNERCLSCHASNVEQAHSANSVHLESGVSCISCHSPHHPATQQFLLVKAQPELCYTCHVTKKAEFTMPFHHRVNEGLIQCSDCHNPHGTAGPKQVRAAATQDAVCVGCHTEKQGPFVYEHAPVKVDGCQSCHLVHGGPNPHMLKVSNVNLLCLQCHTTSSFSSAPGAPSFHNQASFFQSCTLCHSAIHGSNFSSTFFK